MIFRARKHADKDGAITADIPNNLGNAADYHDKDGAMSNKKLQLSRMHKQYGTDPLHTCGQCCNFVRGRYHTKMLQKCERYGLSHSETSDWAQKWTACGMFDVPLENWERPVKEYAKRTPEITQIEGQIGFGDVENERNIQK